MKDGQPFTAKDVAFTFNPSKQYPGIDKAGVWTETFGARPLGDAEGNKVTLAFSGNAAAKYDGIIEPKILPEHVYSTVGDPTKYIDKERSRRAVQGRDLQRPPPRAPTAPDYWQADKIKVQKLVLEGQYDASQAALKLRSGELDAYWGEIPNPEKTFVAADTKTNNFYYAPTG